jgi:hypothetical protein
MNGTPHCYMVRILGKHHRAIHTYFVLANSRAGTGLLITITDFVFNNNVIIIQAQQWGGNK